MAVHRKTQKSLGSYDAKFLGPFTMRQSICLGIGMVPSVLIGYTEYKSGFDLGIIFLTVVIIMASPLFFAGGEKITYGMKPEDFAKQYYIYRIQAPKIRMYKTNTYDDIMWAQKQKEAAKQQTSGKNGTKASKKKGAEQDEEDQGKKNTKKSGPTKGRFRIYDHKKNKSYPDFA